MDDMLNTAQRNSLTITLRMFEEELRQIETWLRGDPTAGILYRSSLRLPPESRALALQTIELALEEIGALAREFDLEPVEHDLAAAVVAEMSVNWTHLCDARAGPLKRYGEVDPRLAHKLDPHINRLAELALALTSAVRGER